LFALAAVVLASATIGRAAPAGDVGPEPIHVTINALNGSGEHGTAVLVKYKGDQTKVTLSLQHVPGGANQPNHIHLGTCGPGLGGVKEPLTNVVRGGGGFGNVTVVTIIDKPLGSFSNGKFSLNVHKSAALLSQYVACGNIQE
jgi:hypothetical protein